jgi:hypothetical protein
VPRISHYHEHDMAFWSLGSDARYTGLDRTDASGMFYAFGVRE